MKKRKKDTKKSSYLTNLIILAGILCLLYPFASDLWNTRHTTKSVAVYSEKIEDLSNDEMDRNFDQAKVFNDKTAYGYPVMTYTDEQEEEYESIFNPFGDGVMGSIEIPAIDLVLPVSHTTNASVLQTGIGHVEGSSLPSGTSDSRVLLMGHRGLPDSSLFLRLNELKAGDLIKLNILDRQMIYQVRDTQITTPEELEELQIEPGQDLITLITCTPFGINTKRLIVNAQRTEPEQTEIPQTNAYSRLSLAVVAAILIGLLITVAVWIIRHRGERKQGTPQTHQQ